MTLWPKESISDRVPPIAGANSAVGKRNVKKPTPFGKYYLLERINVGGMAEVFRAKAFGVEGFERLVAVKRILPNIAEDKEFIRMFIEEAKLAVQLNHANIAQIFDLTAATTSRSSTCTVATCARCSIGADSLAIRCLSHRRASP
jgi:hypothetical protein